MAITFPAGTAKYPRESSLREENQRGSIWQKAARALCIRHKGGPRPGRGTNRWRGLIPSPSLFIPRSEDRSTDGGSGDGTDTRNREIRISFAGRRVLSFESAVESSSFSSSSSYSLSLSGKRLSSNAFLSFFVPSPPPLRASPNFIRVMASELPM